MVLVIVASLVLVLLSWLVSGHAVDVGIPLVGADGERVLVLSVTVLAAAVVCIEVRLERVVSTSVVAGFTVVAAAEVAVALLSV